jgi:hypothetical protein
MELKTLERDKEYEMKSISQELDSKIKQLEFDNSRLQKELDCKLPSKNSQLPVICRLEKQQPIE